MKDTQTIVSVLLLTVGMYIHYTLCMYIKNGKSDRYFTDLRGQKCQCCAPGYYMKKSCSITSGPSVCEPCPDGYYMDRSNNDTACYQCSYDCAFEQLIKLKNCTKLHDVICHCPDGMYFVPLQGGEGDGRCYVCDTCSQGEQISKNCTHWNNIECLPSNKSSSPGSTPSQSPSPTLRPSTPPHSQQSTPSPSPTSNTSQPTGGGSSNNQDYIIIVVAVVFVAVGLVIAICVVKNICRSKNNASIPSCTKKKPKKRRRRRKKSSYNKVYVNANRSTHIDISSSSSDNDGGTWV